MAVLIGMVVISAIIIYLFPNKKDSEWLNWGGNRWLCLLEG